MRRSKKSHTFTTYKNTGNLRKPKEQSKILTLQISRKCIKQLKIIVNYNVNQASQPASQPASQRTSQSGSQPASQGPQKLKKLKKLDKLKKLKDRLLIYIVIYSGF